MPRVKRGVTARARHKKILKQAKAIMGRVAAFIALPNKPSSKPVSMRTATANKENANSVPYGLSVSMRQPVNLAFLTAV